QCGRAEIVVREPWHASGRLGHTSLEAAGPLGDPLGFRNREPFKTAIDFHCGGQGAAAEGRRGASPAGGRLRPWLSDSQWARNALLFSQTGVVHATPGVIFLAVLEDESPRRRRGRRTPIRPPTPTGPASQALGELRRHFTAQGTTLASH